MPEYTITSSTLEGEIPFKDGTKMNKIVLSLRNADGIEKHGVELWQKPETKVPLEGETLTGTVQDKGGKLKFKKDFQARAGGFTPGGQSDANGDSIEAQVAYKGAIELVAAGKATVEDIARLTASGAAAIKAAKA